MRDTSGTPPRHVQDTSETPPRHVRERLPRLPRSAPPHSHRRSSRVPRLGLERLVRAVYDLLGLQTFYTAGPKEVRAWTIRRGTAAPQAAGVIHTDFEKGFIRAECYSIADLVEYETEAAIKGAGKLRTEGRDYLLREDDICHFLIGK